MPQIIETNRLILKSRTMDDLKQCIEMDVDTEVTQYIPGVWDGSSKHIAFLEERITKSYPLGLGYWSIFPKDNAVDFFGWVHLLPIRDDKRTSEIGWRLKRSAWGEGYANEAVQAILTYAFETIGFERVVAYTHTENIRSQKMMKRLEFKYVSDFIYEGRIPSLFYEIIKQQ